MLNNLATSLFQLTPFDLSNLEGFPNTAWLSQNEYYLELENWYKGVPLSAVTIDKTTGRRIEKFPIKINPIKGTCQKHASTVIGQSVDSIRFGGLPFQLIPDMKKGKKKQGDTIKEALMKVFIKNALGATFLSNCIVSQYLGGSILAAKWLPQEKTIEISTPSPKEFMGIPDGANYWSLREAWIIREISQSDAKNYGYIPVFGESKFYYIEYWTKKSYKIMVNGKIINFPGTDIPQGGVNPFGRVPIIYIPHIRTTTFLGDSIITDTMRGVIKEMNLRMADIGDAVSEDSHNYVAVRNVRGGIKTIFLGDGRPVQNLGGGSGIGNEPQPDMFAVVTKSASEPMVSFSEDLYKIYRREANHPAVADGEDEGSQRSSLTLAVRMAPLVAEAEMERLFYSIGLSFFAEILLTMMAEKGLFEITKEMIETEFVVQWQSMLPRDREALATEAAVRAKNKLGSKKHLTELFGDVNDIDDEMRLIEEDVKFEQKDPAFGNNGSGGGDDTQSKKTS